MSTDLDRRAAAAQATLRAFDKKPLRYGYRDCLRMFVFHLRKMGYTVKLPPSGAYRSPRSAMRELNARGFANLIEAVDSMGFPRIAPAAAIVGDGILVPAEGEFGGALHIALGNGRSLSYHQDAVGTAVLQPMEFVTAWRIQPR